MNIVKRFSTIPNLMDRQRDQYKRSAFRFYLLFIFDLDFSLH